MRSGVQVPFHTGMYVTLGKQYYAFKQYSKFIKNGAIILHSSQPNSTLVAKSGIEHPQIVIVATNVLIDYDVVNFDLSGCWPEASTIALEIWRTSVTEDCQQVARIEAQAPLRYGCPLRPLSVTTFVATFVRTESRLISQTT
jgi:O-glycosyl hydrolase